MIKERNGLGKESVLAIVTRVGTIAVGFFLSLFLGRTLGADGSGQFFKVFSLISFLSILTKSGFDRTMMRFASTYWSKEQWNELKGLKRYATKIVSQWSLLSFFLMFALAPEIAQYVMNDSSLTKLVRIGSLALITMGLVQNNAESLKGIGRVQLGLFYSSGLIQAVFLILSAIVVLLVWRGSVYSLELVMTSFSSAVLFSAIIVFFSWYRITNSKLKQATPDNSHINQWRTSARAMFWASVFQQATGYLPVFVLSLATSDSDVGLFEMSKRAAQLTAFFLVATNSVLGPRISTLYSKGDLIAIQQICQKVTGLVLLLSTPVFLIYFLFPHLMMGLFGHDFIQGKDILIVLTIGQFINVIMGPTGFILMMTGREHKMRNIIIFSFGALVLLLLIDVPKYGALGAAVALSGSLIIQNILSGLVIWWELKIITLPIFQYHRD